MSEGIEEPQQKTLSEPTTPPHLGDAGVILVGIIVALGLGDSEVNSIPGGVILPDGTACRYEMVENFTQN